MAAHDSGRQLVVFGGRDSGGTALGDTWLFSRGKSAWTLLEATGPSARFGHAVSVDQDRERMYVFGGQAGSEFYNDLWELDLVGGEWTQLSDGSEAPITPRYGTSMTLDPEGRLFVSHGFTFEGRFDDTWSYNIDSGSWSESTPEADLPRPLKRCLHESVWADHLGRMVLFGGCSSGFGPCPQGDLWVLEPSTRTWSDRSTSKAPAARSNPALIYDRGREQLLLLGGLTEAGYAGDFWTLTFDEERTPSWSVVDLAGPSPRASHDAVITGPWIYLFGGLSDSGAMNDLWVLDVRELNLS